MDPVRDIRMFFENIARPEEPPLLFTKPKDMLIARSRAELPALFARAKTLLRSNLHVAGFFGYEAAETSLESDRPVALLCAFENPRKIPWSRISSATSDAVVFDIRGDSSREEYGRMFRRAQRLIRMGETYQINLSFRVSFKTDASPESLYGSLRETQPTHHCAFLDLPDSTILSLSPELFLKKTGNRILSKPMKGTAPGSLTPEEAVLALRKDKKNISENIMILDLMRNDIGQCAIPGSVRAFDMFQVEKIHTVHQMTSSVEGSTRRDMDPLDIAFSLFPCGSVTGAPKKRSMEIIRNLEKSNRGIYTGCIGFFSPDKDFSLNVAIRTMELDKHTDSWSLGIGSGVVGESREQNEWEECWLKAKFLTESNKSLRLLETMRAENGIIPMLSFHFRRLRTTARFFGFPEPSECDFKKAINEHLEQSIFSRASAKTRLSFGFDSSIRLQSETLRNPPENAPVGLADEPSSSRDWRWRYKTSERGEHHRLLQFAQSKGMFDAVSFNEKGFLTQTSRHNIWLLDKNVFLTPPLEDGALSGTMRAKLLHDPNIRCATRSLTKDDWLNPDMHLFLSNAVLGLFPAKKITENAS